MVLTQELKLNINQTPNYTYVTAKQADDNSRFLKITFCNDSEELSVPAGAIVTLRALKPDGTSCAISGTRNADGTVTVELTSQVLAVEGLVMADVSTAQNGEILSSATFIIKVGGVPIGTAIVSTNDFLQLSELYTQISSLFPVDTANIVDGAVTAAKCGDYVFCFRGEISDLAYTSVNQCKNAGWYRFSTADLATFGDMPADITTGGIVKVFNHTSTARWQMILTPYNMYSRYNSNNVPGTWRSLNGSGGKIKPRVIWNTSGDGNDNSVERIMIYQYASSELSNDNRITISLYHSTYATNDADVWRLGYVYKYINGTSTRLTRQSEWECAMSVNGSGTYIGGYIHGHEKNPTISVYVDNLQKTDSQLAVATEFDTLRIISTSDIYNTDGTTKIAEHGKEWKYEDGVLTVSQSLKFVGSFTINNCYLTMLPPLKDYFYGYYYNGQFKETTFPADDYNVDLPGMTEAVVCGLDAWFMAGHTYYPNVDARTPFMTDHNSEYHKFYFPACDNTAVSNGDIWMSRSYFKFV